MNKWTPGPWSARRAIYPMDGEYDYAIAAVMDGSLLCIAEAFGRADTAVRPPAEANARLIAAAPEMAEALAEMVALYDVFAGEDECDLEEGVCAAPICKAAGCAVAKAARARAALARARGES